MKVKLKRNWFGPNDVRYRKDKGPFDMGRATVLQLPRDAQVQLEDGTWISALEYRTAKARDLPVVQPKRPVDLLKGAPVAEGDEGKALDAGRANEEAAAEVNEKAELFRKQLEAENASKKDVVEAGKPRTRKRD